MNNILHAEWIEYMNAYRIFDPENPQQTIAYDEHSIEEIDKDVRERGYDGVVECGNDYENEPIIKPDNGRK